MRNYNMLQCFMNPNHTEWIVYILETIISTYHAYDFVTAMGWFLFFCLFFFYVTRTEIIELLKRWIKQNKYGLLNPLFFPRTSTKSTVIIFFVKIFCSPNDHVSLSSHSPPPPQHFLPLSHSPQTSSIPTQMNRTRGSEQWGLDPFRSHPDVSFNPVISCNYSNGCRRWSDHICTRN